MRLLASLRSRVFLASLLVALLCVALALRAASGAVAANAEQNLRSELERSANLALEQQADRVRTLLTLARLVADLPKLKAAVETSDPPTVEPIARDYRDRTHADLFVLTGAQRQRLAALGAGELDESTIDTALQRQEAQAFVNVADGLVETVAVPITIGPRAGDVLGTLTVGLAIDQALAQRLDTATGSRIAFVQGDHVRATTLPGLAPQDLARLVTRTEPSSVRWGDEEFLALARPLSARSGGPFVVVLRSRTEQLRVLAALRTALFWALAPSVLLAVALSWGVARTVTRPLSAITARMRATAATGDLGGAVELPQGWHDEEARTLATAFNALLESLARFQREAARRQRLSALGRISTVIAHEVRNPLMVIKAALPVLTDPHASAAELHEVARDIDTEVGRIDRIVGDVLDFTREVRVSPAPAEPRALVEAACTSALRPHGSAFEIAEAPCFPGRIVTDGERLRQVLVALLSNAREAQAGRPDPIQVGLSASNGRIAVEVRDHGPGIAVEHLPHVFEAYFTTKRTGTGLGLAVARNIVEALDGSLTASNAAGGGALLRLELPALPAPPEGS